MVRVVVWIAIGLLSVGCTSDLPAATAPVASGPRHVVQIRVPSGLGALRTGRRFPSGEPDTIPCGTCHAGGPRALAARNPGAAAIHGDVELRHGSLTCLSCHDREVRDELRLADGRTLPFSRTLDLCAQCHGPQTRDYDHGSHGGMMGYWDLNRGPRTRNHCVVCHAPHDPAIRQVRPVPPPPDAPHGGS